MHKRLLASLGVAVLVTALAVGGTVAYFSDTEKSTGNTFAAGSIDLKVSNDSYVTDTTTGDLVASKNTSWASTDLTVEKFFNFTDLKPGDVGEDTIDLIVDNNPAWVCAELTLTTNDDSSCTEPELEDDANCAETDDDVLDGDLAQSIEFIWWADDGDNVLETDEVDTVYFLGPDSISNLLGADDKLQLTLADSTLNFFDRTTGTDAKPLKGETTYHVGKGWCFGEMTLAPVADTETIADVPSDVNTSPLERGTGFTCNGANVDNAAQSDTLTADIEFTAVQARNSDDYLCPEHQQQ